MTTAENWNQRAGWRLARLRAEHTMTKATFMTVTGLSAEVIGRIEDGHGVSVARWIEWCLAVGANPVQELAVILGDAADMEPVIVDLRTVSQYVLRAGWVRRMGEWATEQLQTAPATGVMMLAPETIRALADTLHASEAELVEVLRDCAPLRPVVRWKR